MSNGKDDQKPPVVPVTPENGDTSEIGTDLTSENASGSLFQQEKAHFDERSPLEHEDDHSSDDFDIDAELTAKLGPETSDTSQSDSSSSFTSDDASEPVVSDTSGSPSSDGLFSQEKVHFDERSPLEHEDDHSSADFDIDAELTAKLGPETSDTSQSDSSSSFTSDNASEPVVSDTSDSRSSDGLFSQEKLHFDERSPLEHEADHSSADFDIDAELTAKLGSETSNTTQNESASSFTSDNASEPVVSDTSSSLSSDGLFSQEKVHFDERSPLEHEDDHSGDDLDVDAEIEAQLGPAREDAAQNTNFKDDADSVLGIDTQDAADDEGIKVPDEDSRSALEPEDTGEDDGSVNPEAENAIEAAGDVSQDSSLALREESAPSLITDEAEDEQDDDDEYEEDDEEEDEEDRPMTLRDHLNDLRKRVFRAFLFAIVGFMGCYPFAKQITQILLKPLATVKPVDQPFIYTQPAEAFFAELKIAFVAGIFAASPLIFYQIWAFIAPGLYKEEKLYIIPIALFSAFFFISGGAFCYFVVFPFAFEFFMSYNSEYLKAMLDIRESLGFVLQLLLAFGLVFELPLFIFFLARLGIVTADMLKRFRRYAVLIMFIVAAILTPPDVISQLLMAGPLLVLYELSIVIATVFGRKKKTPEPDEDDEEDDEEEESETSVKA